MYVDINLFTDLLQLSLESLGGKMVSFRVLSNWSTKMTGALLKQFLILSKCKLGPT